MICSIKTIKELFWDVKIWWTPAREKAEYFWWGIPWVSIKDMEGKKEIFETNETLSKLWVKNSNVKLIKRWSLLFSFKLTVGRMCFAWVDLYTNEAIAAFEPNKHINLEYLYYILPVVANKVDRTNNYGAPLLNKNVIKSLQIPLPPLEIQQKIVEKLDELSAVIKENQEKIRGQIIALDELWESKLDEVFSNEEWKIVKLGDVIELNYWKWLSKTERWEDLPNPVYGANWIIDYTKEYMYDWEAIIVWRKWSAGALTKVKWKFWASDVTYYILGNDSLNIDYIFLMLSNLQLPTYAQWVKPWINRNTVYDIKVRHTSNFETQKAIVEELDELQKGITELKTQYTTQLEQYDELRNSLLDQAFKGELVK